MNHPNVQMCIKNDDPEEWERIKHNVLTRAKNQELCISKKRNTIQSEYLGTSFNTSHVIFYTTAAPYQVTAFVMIEWVDSGSNPVNSMHVVLVCSSKEGSARWPLIRAIQFARDRGVRFAYLEALRTVWRYYPRFGFRPNKNAVTKKYIGNDVDGFRFVRHLDDGKPNYASDVPQYPFPSRSTTMMMSQPTPQLQRAQRHRQLPAWLKSSIPPNNPPATPPPTPTLPQEKPRATSPRAASPRAASPPPNPPRTPPRGRRRVYVPKYPIGTAVWAKSDGFGYWPAIVDKPRKKSHWQYYKPGHTFVAFFNDTTYAWIGVNKIALFTPDDDGVYYKSIERIKRKSKPSQYDRQRIKAVEDAQAYVRAMNIRA